MEDLLIIADIAGQYDALMRLVAKVPETTKILAVGDLVDRGPDSKKVIEWFMANAHRADSLLGNHEHMMLDFYHETEIYDHDVWVSNGGGHTIRSYYDLERNVSGVPPEHLGWLATRQRYKVIPGEGNVPKLIVTHAAKDPGMTLEEAAFEYRMRDRHFDSSLLWNRNAPEEIPGAFQVFGHNSHWGIMKFDDWGICIDGSRQDVLTGFLWPTRELIQEPYNE